MISDKTNLGQNINVSFKGELREEQQKAIEAFAGHNIGMLSATTAFGKTVFAIGMIAKRKVNTLILVHNKALLEQWKDRLETFLKIDETIAEPEAKRGRKKIFHHWLFVCWQELSTWHYRHSFDTILFERWRSKAFRQGLWHGDS